MSTIWVLKKCSSSEHEVRPINGLLQPLNLLKSQNGKNPDYAATPSLWLESWQNREGELTAGTEV